MGEDILHFYKGKKIFITGHTGFKGAWLSNMLVNVGADVIGYSTYNKKDASLFELTGVAKHMNCIKGDIRDYASLKRAIDATKPEIVFHLAAQPIVISSYQNPVYTYETNVLGTVNILDCARQSNSIESILNVTTDKVYKNNEWEWGYRENEPLDGFDPYSNSKSCSELVTHSYVNSFFRKMDIAVSTARAGNVIGGGDFAPNRIIPDCVRAAIKGETLELRNPFSTRPYQHVLEPLFAYILIAQKQIEDKKYAGWYNIGPDEQDCVTTELLVKHFAKSWGAGFTWEDRSAPGAYHEANFLKLDCAKIKSTLQWKPRWNIIDAVQSTVEWTKSWIANENINATMQKQIDEYRSVQNDTLER